MKTNRSLLFALCLLFASNQLSAMDVNNAKVIGWGLIGAIAYLGADKLKEYPRIVNFAKKIDRSPKDIARIAGISATCFALSGIASSENKTTLWHFGKYAPVAAATIAVTVSKSIKPVLKNVPFFGPNLICDETIDEEIEVALDEKNEQVESDATNIAKKIKIKLKHECPGLCRNCVLTTGAEFIAMYLTVKTGIKALGLD